MLSHPARLAILSLLREGEACVCHLEVHLGKRQAYLSQQLMVLRQSGLVRMRKEGWNVYYSVIDDGLFALLDAAMLMAYTAEEIHALALEKKNAHCTCPKCSCKTMLISDV